MNGIVRVIARLREDDAGSQVKIVSPKPLLIPRGPLCLIVPAWTCPHRLTKVIKSGDSSLVAAYRYDHRGLRIEKTTPTGTVRYSWNDAEQTG